ncbi:MAG: hypothetical protein P8M34_07140 [Saprospiraceae bacterium]|nr:hypothetical protein [Saprospiraceae bacterium]|tara:strand:- start:2339 stop:2881 length:543 start_codon:yes stop_codon:yes gene_type:complete
MINRQFRILIFLSVLGLMTIVWFFQLLSSNESFFSAVEEKYEISIDEKLHEEYERMRDERNRKRMIENYNELLKRGKKFNKIQNYHDAAVCYYYAKTIFPRREAPRRHLSEAYMNLCARYGEYCKEAKKEVYYAFRYVKDTSNYYPDMLDMASGLDLYPYLDRHEGDVMKMIYNEKGIKL